MAARVTTTSASVGSIKRASGTFSIRTSPAPYMTVAFIFLIPFLVCLIFGTPRFPGFLNFHLFISFLIFSMRTLDSKEGHHVPGVAYAHQQKQDHCGTDDIEWGH